MMEAPLTEMLRHMDGLSILWMVSVPYNDW